MQILKKTGDIILTTLFFLGCIIGGLILGSIIRSIILNR